MSTEIIPEHEVQAMRERLEGYHADPMSYPARGSALEEALAADLARLLEEREADTRADQLGACGDKARAALSFLSSDSK